MFYIYSFEQCLHIILIDYSIGGVVLVSLSDRDFEAEIPVGALWALSGALLYALYLVLLRRRVDNEDKLNIPMFFGKSRKYVDSWVEHFSKYGFSTWYNNALVTI